MHIHTDESSTAFTSVSLSQKHHFIAQFPCLFVALPYAIFTNVTPNQHGSPKQEIVNEEGKICGGNAPQNSGKCIWIRLMMYGGVQIHFFLQQNRPRRGVDHIPLHFLLRPQMSLKSTASEFCTSGIISLKPLQNRSRGSSWTNASWSRCSFLPTTAFQESLWLHISDGPKD